MSLLKRIERVLSSPEKRRRANYKSGRSLALESLELRALLTATGFEVPLADMPADLAPAADLSLTSSADTPIDVAMGDLTDVDDSPNTVAVGRRVMTVFLCPSAPYDTRGYLPMHPEVEEMVNLSPDFDTAPAWHPNIIQFVAGDGSVTPLNLEAGDEIEVVGPDTIIVTNDETVSIYTEPDKLDGSPAVTPNSAVVFAGGHGSSSCQYNSSLDADGQGVVGLDTTIITFTGLEGPEGDSADILAGKSEPTGPF